MKNSQPSEAMKKFLNYTYSGKCWVCGAQLEKGRTVCFGMHKNERKQETTS